MLSKIVSVPAGSTKTIAFDAEGAARTSTCNTGKPTITIIIAGGATANCFNKNGGWRNSGPGGERKSDWNYHRD